MIATRKPVVFAVAVAIVGCSNGTTPPPAALIGAPSTAEYAALQAGDVPKGLVRCAYSGPMTSYLEGIKRLSEKAYGNISATWAALQAAGAAEGYVAVYSGTAGACDVWVAGEDGIHVRGGSRVVSTVVVKFPETATAEAAYAADIFKQSALQDKPGLQVLVGSATGLSSNSIVGANEAANPAVHQAVWQNGPFNVFLTGRNLTRPEFTSASSLAFSRTQ